MTEREAFEAWLLRRQGPTGDTPGYPGSMPFFHDQEAAAWEGGQAARAQPAQAESVTYWQRGTTLPAQAGQVLTDEEIDAAYEKARAGYQRSRFAVRGQQLTAQDSPDWWFARAIEAAVLAKRVPMTDAQIDESMRAKFYPARNRAFVDGVEAVERHHGIVGKEGA